MNKKLELSLLPLCILPSFVYGLEKEKPNVILIYADDLGRGLLSHFGQEHFSTPNIDKLFKKGTYFTRAYGSTYSAPSRASLLTGYSDLRDSYWNISNGGVYKTIKSEEDFAAIEAKVEAERVKLPKDDLLLPQIFKRAGYKTAQIGKLEWGFLATRKQMQENEWDYYYGFLDHGHAHVFYPHYLFENGKMVIIQGNTHPTSGRGFENESQENYKLRWMMEGKESYSQDLFLDKILNFISENKNNPFFLYHSTQLPHGPVAIPKVHETVKNNPHLSEIEKEYASMVIMLDEHLGLIIKELEKHNIADNTIIVFSSDNGHETYYENGVNAVKSPNRDTDGRKFDAWNYVYTSKRTGDKFDGNNGMSGKKWSNLDGGVNVPLTFYWEGKIGSNIESKEVVANYDLVPTFADMLGVKLKHPKDGESLLPIIFNGRNMLKKERYVAVNSTIGPMIVSSKGWKLRYNNIENGYKLHYLPSDYREEINILNPKKIKKLRKHLISYEIKD